MAEGTPAPHVPVMPERVLALLAPALAAPGAVLVDATLGFGGHAELLLRAHPGLRLVGLDRDPAALRASRARLTEHAGRITLVHAVYDQLPRVLHDLGHSQVQGVLFDLGVSSVQLDERERGFAYSYDAPLDMRMDPTAGVTAADVVNGYAADELARVLREYGEERYAKRIAAAVVRERAREPFTSTARLAAAIRDAMPAAVRHAAGGGHPAKRSFQALRIEVNGELEALERALPAALAALAVGGRVAVLSYHSLEDRLVKQVLRAGATSTAPADLPVVPPELEPELRLLTRGAERPDAAELARNGRAASARLRAAERIRARRAA
ncbi:MAG: 16S rRNA (cytosine(1402)-N(4))-methyltransferase RsmH [Streptosporangiales bacterium]|nr:16S rRNA (cytosine(1402)-N(4))-methyltransferase RsmH [Streptosporangiales bacterium]MBO0891987.1 16S rRNA (cytosine(1402)-N(4))-methyltransferase RsmH [Acidothermales bacterium]